MKTKHFSGKQLRYAVFVITLIISLTMVPNASAFEGGDPSTAMDGTSTNGSNGENEPMPSSLQEAILAASAEPFTQSGGEFTTQHNGVDYRLRKAGLQASSEGLRWGITLRGFGREGHSSDVSQPEIVQSSNQLEYRRGNLTEWYRDTLHGVEQGFTIAEPPKGNGRLVLQLALDTDLTGSPDSNGRGVSFAGPDGTTLRYDGLKAYDAEGMDLEARFITTPAQIVIRVDDRGAAYPVTIDPFIYLEQKVIAADGTENGRFGYSVAISGDTALVGAFRDDIGANIDQGSAYVFVRSGTTWSQQDQLTASDGEGGDYFGNSVALDGDTALVGAYGDDANQGSAYVFTRSGSSWSEQDKLTASDGAADDWFGCSVALYGDTALVGAPDDDVDPNSNQGSAYVFVRSGTSWSQQDQLTASDGLSGDNFGISVALSGNTALVGAFRDDIGANIDQGSAYVFVRSETSWSEQDQLTASDGLSGDNFGQSVALSGDTALVGAPYDDVDPNSNQGSAYIFTRSGSTWSFPTKLTASDGAAYDYFSWSVALYGNTALVGANGDDGGGSAYVFTHSGSTWNQEARLTASDGTANDQFGRSVALSEDSALVGAPHDDIGANIDQGSAYFFQPHSDLGLSAVFSTASAQDGDTVLLTTRVANFGPTYSTFDLSATAPLPTGLIYESSAATHGTYNPTSGAWKIGMLPSGASATLTITASIDSRPRTLTFKASLDGGDTNPANNTTSASLKVLPITLVFTSNGAQDGWVLESGESTGVGGSKNNTQTTLLVGDNPQDKQYRSILSFDTSALPDNARITKVILMVRKAGVTGTNPMRTHNGLYVDLKKVKFSTRPTLQLNDFQAGANMLKAGKFSNRLYSGWYKAPLARGAFRYINKYGNTQLRLRFLLDDNDDNGADVLKLFSGNAALAKHPKLIVQYYIP